jgi:hypothetical protein
LGIFRKHSQHTIHIHIALIIPFPLSQHSLEHTRQDGLNKNNLFSDIA